MFTQVLLRGLPKCQHIRSRIDLDQVTNNITTAIQKAIEDTIPTAIICARSIPGFTDERKDAIEEVKRAQRRWRSRPTESNLHELQQAKHTRASLISRETEMRTEKGYRRLQMRSRYGHWQNGPGIEEILGLHSHLN